MTSTVADYGRRHMRFVALALLLVAF